MIHYQSQVSLSLTGHSCHVTSSVFPQAPPPPLWVPVPFFPGSGAHKGERLMQAGGNCIPHPEARSVIIDHWLVQSPLCPRLFRWSLSSLSLCVDSSDFPLQGCALSHPCCVFPSALPPIVDTQCLPVKPLILGDIADAKQELANKQGRRDHVRSLGDSEVTSAM